MFTYREQDKVEGGKRIFSLSLLLEIIFRGNTLGRNALLEFSTTLISLSRIARAAERMKVAWLLAYFCLTGGRISEEGSAALGENLSGSVLHAEVFESLESISHDQLVQLLHRLATTL